MLDAPPGGGPVEPTPRAADVASAAAAIEALRRSTRRARPPYGRIGLSALLLVAVSAALLSYATRAASEGFAVDAAARLVPADSGFFVTLNTDLASDPWRALPGLLAALGVEQRLRDEVVQAVEGDGRADYTAEFLPALASIRAVAVAARTTEQGDAVVAVFDTRDPSALVALIERSYRSSDPDLVRRDTEDAALGGTLVRLRSAGDEGQALLVDGDLVYFADRAEQIADLRERLAAAGPLSEAPRFRELLTRLDGTPLLAGYMDGSAAGLASSLFAGELGSLDAAYGSGLGDVGELGAGGDLGAWALAFNVTATAEGFAARVIADPGTPAEGADVASSLPGALAVPLSGLGDLAGATPSDALVFVAASGLREALSAALDFLEGDGEEFAAAFLTPFEQRTGLRLRQDLLPLFGSSYGAAMGVTDVQQSGFWLTAQLESPDPPALRGALAELVGALEQSTGFPLDLEWSERPAYVGAWWDSNGAGRPPVGSLATNGGFVSTRALLPPTLSGLVYFNLQALPADAVGAAQIALHSDEVPFIVRGVRGVAVASSQLERYLRVDLVVPIAPPAGGG